MTRVIEKRYDLADAPAFAAARAVCRRHGRGFYLACVFLPQAKRDAACAVFAFHRLIGEAIGQPDPSDPPSSAATIPGSSCCSGGSLDQSLAMVRHRLEDIYAGRLELPLPQFRGEEQHVLQALASTVHRHEIPMQYFLDMAEGYRMDRTISRYATWNALEKYCYYTGGVASLILSCIFGLRHSEARHQAVKLGNAMRLTNMLRHVGKDRNRGRIYLPLEDMVRFRYGERDLAGGAVNDNFRRLMKFQIARARKLYSEGAEGICWLADDGSRLTAASLAAVQSGLLNTIERRNYDVFSTHAKMSAGQKLRRFPAAWRLARRQADEPMPIVFEGGGARD